MAGRYIYDSTVSFCTEFQGDRMQHVPVHPTAVAARARATPPAHTTGKTTIRAYGSCQMHDLTE